MTPILKQFSHDECMSVLHKIRLALDAALIPFFLDRSTLHSIVNRKPLQAVNLGIRRADMNKDAMSILLDQYTPLEMANKGILFNIDSVPVSIKIYESNNSMIVNTDTIQYAYETWQIPNPYDKFWEQRNEIT